MASLLTEDEAWLSQLTGIPNNGAAPTLTSNLGDAHPEGSAATAAPSDDVARLRGIFSSIDEEIISMVLATNHGSLVPSILQLIELADENETASCMDELEAALQDAAIRDEAPGHNRDLSDIPEFDAQVALAAQADMDEQVALALQQKLDADAAAAAAAGTRRASTPPTLSTWRRNAAKLASKLSPSELGQLAERVRKTGRYGGRGGAGTARLIDNEGGVTADNNESDGSDDREYEPPLPPAPKPSAAALYESRVARARSARMAGRSAAPSNQQGFTDLSLVNGHA